MLTTLFPDGLLTDIAGWGVTNVTHPEQSPSLKVVKQEIISWDDCETTFYDLEDFHMCAGGVNKSLNNAACYVIIHLTHFKSHDLSLYFILKTNNVFQCAVGDLVSKHKLRTYN